MNLKQPEVFQTTLQKTNIWIKQISDALHWDDHQKAYHGLRAVLHALRDRLPVPEAAHFGAQLPMLIRGFYYDEWKPASTPVKLKTAQDFYDTVKANFEADKNVKSDAPDSGRLASAGAKSFSGRAGKAAWDFSTASARDLDRRATKRQCLRLRMRATSLIVIADRGGLKAYRVDETPTRGASLQLVQAFDVPNVNDMSRSHHTTAVTDWPQLETEESHRICKQLAEEIAELVRLRTAEGWSFAAPESIYREIVDLLPAEIRGANRRTRSVRSDQDTGGEIGGTLSLPSTDSEMRHIFSRCLRNPEPERLPWLNVRTAETNTTKRLRLNVATRRWLSTASNAPST